MPILFSSFNEGQQQTEKKRTHLKFSRWLAALSVAPIFYVILVVVRSTDMRNKNEEKMHEETSKTRTFTTKELMTDSENESKIR